MSDREVLRHNATNAATGGIWRVRRDDDTAILKVARPPSPNPVGGPAWQTSDDPAHWNYWRREPLAYRSGLVDAYAADGITAPPLLDLIDRPDGAVEMWLGDVPGVSGARWPVERLGAFARRLGAAQARYVGHLPDLPFLSRDWLPQYLSLGLAAHTVIDDADWNHPVAAVWPAPVRASLRRLWLRRDDALAVAQRAPRTLCHLDLWIENMIGAGDAMTLLDWSFTGEGGIGEDPANLIVDAVTDGLIDAALLPQIDAAVTDGYCAGLRDGGWRGNDTAVRASITAYAAAKYCWFAPRRLRNAVHSVDVTASAYGQDTSPVEAMSRLGGLVTAIAGWADQTLGT